MDKDRLTPQLGRLIDAAKDAAVGTEPAGAGADVAGAAGAPRAEGWAVLGLDGKVYAGRRLGSAVAAARGARTDPEAAAFAVSGESAETLLPAAGWRDGLEDVDPRLPVTLKYLGRWVVVTLGEIPEACP